MVEMVQTMDFEILSWDLIRFRDTVIMEGYDINKPDVKMEIRVSKRDIAEFIKWWNLNKGFI